MKNVLMTLSIALGMAIATAAVGVAEEKPQKGEGKPDAEMMFKRLDKDGNGALTVEEFLGKREGEKADKAREVFKKLDKDQNGTVSLKEFKERPMRKPKPKSNS